MSYAELIRTNPDFRWLWTGQIVSLLGDWFNLIASAMLVARLTGLSTAVGGLFVVRMLAPFLASPLAGVVADRYSRKWILVAADLARTGVVLGFLLVRSVETVWLLYVLTAVQLGISAFFFAARNAVLPELVGPRAVGAANAISSVTWSVMLALGAALGGLVAGTVGVYPAFVIDSLTFLVSAAAISRIRSAHLPEHAMEKTLSAAFEQYVGGLSYLRRHSSVLALTLHKAALTLLFGPTLNVVYVAIAEQRFPSVAGPGKTALSLGLMFAAGGLGTGAGPLIVRTITSDQPARLRWAIAAGYLLGGLGLLVAAPLWNFPVVLLGFFFSGAGNGVVWVFSTQLLLQSVPSEVRGRVFASEFALFTLASAAGASVVGSILDTSLGMRYILWAMSAMALLPATLWALWLGRGQDRA